MSNKKAEILIFFGGALSTHVIQILGAFEKIGEPVSYSNYDKLTFQVGRDNCQQPKLAANGVRLDDFKVIFFRSIGNSWEKISLINLFLEERIKSGQVKIVDPLVKGGNRYPSMKAYQMFAFQKAGLPVPRTLFGSLSFLQDNAALTFNFPFIIKRSEGGRGERVYLVNNQAEIDSLVSELLPQEKEERKTFFAQEFVENQGDLRILVLGGQILGAMKRVRTRKGEFRNNISLGGKAEQVAISKDLETMALKAANICQTSLAGVDIILRSSDERPFLLEVNRAPQFKGFMEATGVDVPLKIARYLIGLKDQVKG